MTILDDRNARPRSPERMFESLPYISPDASVFLPTRVVNATPAALPPASAPTLPPARTPTSPPPPPVPTPPLAHALPPLLAPLPAPAPAPAPLPAPAPAPNYVPVSLPCQQPSKSLGILITTPLPDCMFCLPEHCSSRARAVSRSTEL